MTLSGDNIVEASFLNPTKEECVLLGKKPKLLETLKVTSLPEHPEISEPPQPSEPLSKLMLLVPLLLCPLCPNLAATFPVGKETLEGDWGCHKPCR